MTLAIITHTPHFKVNEQLYAYGPYIREMNLWTQHFDSVQVVAPISNEAISKIHLPYLDSTITVKKIPAISLQGAVKILRAWALLPLITYRIFNTMRKADHIHLRCPGNIGLIGCVVQVFFPRKTKTAKYAGNWDAKAKQPWSYRLQKWILSNTFWTKNMQVLVYGSWPNQSKNVKAFFTATYSEEKQKQFVSKIFQPPFHFLFVGSLSHGKRPLYAMQLIKEIRAQGFDVSLDVYGEGAERESLEAFIKNNSLESVITLHGNQTAEIVEQAYKSSHFLVLPSKSEGWPKVVAEAMFWKCIPLVTKVSCVPWMLDYGKRGGLLSMDISEDINTIKKMLENNESINKTALAGQIWSQEYTLDKFESEIKKLVL